MIPLLPFSLQIPLFRVWMWVMKIAAKVLRIREPRQLRGPGASLQLCDAIAADGVKTLLVVSDAILVKIGLLQPMLDRLKNLGIDTVIYDGVEPNPTIAQVESGLALLKQSGATAILAVGGGSPIDAAKAIGARATNGWLSVRGLAGLLRVLRKPLPLYVVPTTAGTGSEVTIGAVITDPQRQRKLVIMDPNLIPKVAALDAALMTGLPPAVTAATGMDALTHAIEAYLSRNATPKTDAQALQAATLIAQNLPRVMADGGDLEARQNMSEAAYLAGAAITVAGLGYVHAISHNFGARYHTPHGVANAIVLPYVLEFSLPDCIERMARMAEACGLHGGPEKTPADLARDLIARIRQMNREYGIPAQLDSLRQAHIPAIARAALVEAHLTYAVPRYMDRPICEQLVARMLC